MTKRLCAPTIRGQSLHLQLLAALGAIFLSGYAPAQDMCAQQCDDRDAACIRACEMSRPTPFLCCSPPPPVLCFKRGKPCISSGVDHGLLGAWELRVPNPAGVSRWVWEIHQNGTYGLHVEDLLHVKDPRFALSNGDMAHGRYIIPASSLARLVRGSYELEDSATLTTTGDLRGTWHRDQPQAGSHLAGTWELRISTPAGLSRWVWDIHQDGTCGLHAVDVGAAFEQGGILIASQGRYVIGTNTMARPVVGSYELKDSATLISTGDLSGTWRRVQPRAAGHRGAPGIEGRKKSPVRTRSEPQ